MSNGAMPLQLKFDVTVTAAIGYGDRQRVNMGWQEAKVYRVKGVPAYTQQEAEQKVLVKFGHGWKLA